MSDTGSTREAGPVQPLEPRPWFATRLTPPAFLYFKINRRPLTTPTLFAQDQPVDFFDHLVEVLLFGDPVITGRAHQRVWLLGSRNIDTRLRVLSGEIGFERAASVTGGHYDMAALEWIDSVQQIELVPRTPFVIDGQTELLVFLEYSAFSPSTIAAVFTMLLRRGEDAREAGPSTEWSVEPLLDQTEFISWIREAESVQRVDFEATLPNPAGLDEFEPVWSRLEARKAKNIKEAIEARDPLQGLIGLEDDPIARAYIAMASRGYGLIRARRLKANRIERFNGGNRVRRGSLGMLPTSWAEAIRGLTERLVGERE